VRELLRLGVPEALRVLMARLLPGARAVPVGEGVRELRLLGVAEPLGVSDWEPGSRPARSGSAPASPLCTAPAAAGEPALPGAACGVVAEV
jgi:hypothetical protein